MSGTISDRYGLDKVIIPACCCFALSFLVMSISTSLILFLVAGAISAFGYGAATLTKKNIDRLDYVYNWATKNGRLKPENNVITLKLDEE